MTQKQTETKKMTKDQTTTNIYTKMHSVMANAGYVQKEKSKGMPYTFASHNAITEVVSKELQRVGLVILPFVKEHMHDGNQHKVVMAAKIVDIDTKEEIVVGDFPGIGNDNQDKGYGKAISYAYKYILQKLFMLDIGDDEEPDLGSPGDARDPQSNEEGREQGEQGEKDGGVDGDANDNSASVKHPSDHYGRKRTTTRRHTS